MHTVRSGQEPQSFGTAAIHFHFISKRSGGEFFKWQMNIAAAGIAILLFIITKPFSR